MPALGFRLLGVALVVAIIDGTPPAQADVAPSGSPCRLGAQSMVRTELVFGTARDPLPAVTDDEWGLFVDAEVARLFPDGFTWIEGRGQWRSSRGTVRETTRLLIVWHRPSPEEDGKVETLRDAYKARFAQDSVIRIDRQDCVGF